MVPDNALLRQYAEHHDDAAFAELVRRHIDLVYSVALRQTNGDTHLAEDATQAVFTDLARKARSLSGRETLAGWLHTSARFAAGNAVRGESRRRAREHEAVTMHELTSSPDMNWDHVRPLLDESVGQLKESDRDAIVLRFFEGKSHEEIGAILGLSENSANKRVERALDKLREHFVRRGVKTSSTLLATAIAENSVQAAPEGMAARITGPSMIAASASTTGVSILLSLLMSTKFKIALLAIISLALVGTLAFNSPGLASLAVPASSAAMLAAPANHLVGNLSNTSSPNPARVAMPVIPAVNPSTAAGTADPGPSRASPYVATPQTDLKSAISIGIHFLEANDLASTLKTLDPPGMLEMKRKSGLGDSEEEMALNMRALDPMTDEYVRQQLDLFRAIQDLTPEISPDGKRATYHLDQPIGGSKDAGFIKVNGFWYYGSGAESDWNAPP